MGLPQVKHQREKFGSKVRFILMNSFSTSDDTKAFLAKDHGDLLAENIELLQNKSPKVDKATLAPATWEKNPGNEWCPPGHGDIYAALAGSGMLDALVADGIEYLFVSNRRAPYHARQPHTRAARPDPLPSKRRVCVVNSDTRAAAPASWEFLVSESAMPIPVSAATTSGRRWTWTCWPTSRARSCPSAWSARSARRRTRREAT